MNNKEKEKNRFVSTEATLVSDKSDALKELIKKINELGGDTDAVHNRRPYK